MPRMKILNSVEREVFDWPPIFNSVEPQTLLRFSHAAPGHRHEPAHGGQSVGLSLELRLFQGH
jgi:hypothetical protein